VSDSMTPAQKAAMMLREQLAHDGITDLEGVINDKSYDEAITADVTIERAVRMAQATSGVVGHFYKGLIEQGVPEAYACKLTDDFWAIYKPFLEKGFGSA
jgi:hypothetical protein